MKGLVSPAIAAFVLALSFGAWGQSAQPELEATINVVPPNAANDTAGAARDLPNSTIPKPPAP